MGLENYIFILTHGKAGEELLKSAQMITGEMKNVKTFSLLPGVSLESYIQEVKSSLDEVPKGATILGITDLYGGTPSNCARALSKDYNFFILAGLNLAMLLEADILRKSLSDYELLEAVQKAGEKACRIVEKLECNM
ncbi:PTS sugar transporter subunit IIA [Irregularibacter muris]|uniref:PTS sugar transporter subunit IIA n=1 Tax=Irregularibacter muris TaxID=1796619 RepID=A0AAE3HGP2_9FIRM|nr:PTS sugar transporter subunit IIA [Irregularibacter muris]MCR1899109.1 PTS sugar transporter subunit IIA [Irregularibacter muris]